LGCEEIFKYSVLVGQSVQSDEDDESQFYDAVEVSDMAEFTVDVPISAHRRTSSGISTDSQVCTLNSQSVISLFNAVCMFIEIRRRKIQF